MANDKDLIVWLQSGNLQALGELYERHQNLVYRTALMITGDPDAACDLLQDVFLRLFRFADHIDPSRPIEPWLYRMTANLSYTWLKRSRRWLPSLEEVADWLIGSRKGSNPPVQEMDEEWQLIEQAVLALPEAQRIVVVLYYLNDLSLQEISDILEVPVGTVKSRLYYSREVIKKELGITTKEKVTDLLGDFT